MNTARVGIVVGVCGVVVTAHEQASFQGIGLVPGVRPPA